MWVSSSARGRSSPRASSSVGRQERRARVDQHVADLPAADHALAAEVHEIDQTHSRHTSHRDSAGLCRRRRPSAAGRVALSGRGAGAPRSPSDPSAGPASSHRRRRRGRPRAGDRSRPGGRSLVDDLVLTLGRLRVEDRSFRRHRCRLVLDGRGRFIVGRREALDRRLGQRHQLPRELARVVDDPLALGPDPVGLGVEVLDPLPARPRRSRPPRAARPGGAPRPRARDWDGDLARPSRGLAGGSPRSPRRRAPAPGAPRPRASAWPAARRRAGVVCST